ncbi:MAG: hypothetical protein JXC32_00430 [Anaerolineae bacterium]|nr:hypothetical protein [Anaerolineae bacterium]
MNEITTIDRAMDEGEGILRLAPNWVPRSFCIPGRRIKLHPDDYYALGGVRGGIDERWFSSTTPADNGPLTAPNEGLSWVIAGNDENPARVLLRDAVDVLQGELIGERLWDAYGSWPMYSKFFDNLGPLPHHVHHRDPDAAAVGQRGKPEAYYFPTQLNKHGGRFPYTFFGIEPGTTKEQVLDALKAFESGDNHITDLSRAYRLRPGTGWDVPAGVLHAPGSLCTYEPQAASDVFSMFQSLVDDKVVEPELFWKDIPEDKVGDYNHMLGLLDWEANIDPHFVKHHFMPPRPVDPVQEMRSAGYEAYWICYLSPAFSAKALTVLPGHTVTVRDAAAYGMIMLQGHGQLGVWPVETPTMIRYGQLAHDEFFVSEAAAQEGVKITNLSATDPLVMLKHFGPGNPDLGL